MGRAWEAALADPSTSLGEGCNAVPLHEIGRNRDMSVMLSMKPRGSVTEVNHSGFAIMYSILEADTDCVEVLPGDGWPNQQPYLLSRMGLTTIPPHCTYTL